MIELGIIVALGVGSIVLLGVVIWREWPVQPIEIDHGQLIEDQPAHADSVECHAPPPIS